MIFVSTYVHFRVPVHQDYLIIIHLYIKIYCITWTSIINKEFLHIVILSAGHQLCIPKIFFVLFSSSVVKCVVLYAYMIVNLEAHTVLKLNKEIHIWMCQIFTKSSKQNYSYNMMNEFTAHICLQPTSSMSFPSTVKKLVKLHFLMNNSWLKWFVRTYFVIRLMPRSLRTKSHHIYSYV
jgi:hypothetical protein